MSFDTSKPSIARTLNELRRDAHAVASQTIAKGTRSVTQDKRRLVSAITSLVDQIDTDDFGVRVIVAKSLK